MSVKWEDPPERTEWVEWYAMCEELKTRPGQWALLREYPTKRRAASDAMSNLARRLVSRPDGRFEFTSRSDGNGGGLLYGRYLGPDEEES